jgi:RNA polymerase sigma-70 factor (ECF subfamily)
MTKMTNTHIKKLSLGDETSFKIIFDDFYPRLTGLANKYVRDMYVAEDIVSEVFRKVWEKRAFISEVGSFDSFLYTAVRNEALNHLRNHSRRQVHHEMMFEESKDQFFNEAVIEEEVHFKLYQAINSLPEKGKKIFELSIINGWKEKEIAEELNISVYTVKTHKKRALKKLREKLGKYYVFIFFYL